MRWDAIVINLQKIGAILILLKTWLNKLRTLKTVVKLYLRLKQAIYSMMQTRIKGLKSSSLLTHSNEITVQQLIKLLSGDNSVLKLKWYARKSWLKNTANELIEDFSQFMSGSDFDKTVIASRQIFQKQANIRAVQLEIYMYRMAIVWGIKTEPTPTLNRFNLNPESPTFNTTYEAWLKRQMQDIANNQKFLDGGKVEKNKEIDYADFISELLITINENHFIDKTTITALDFYKMHSKFKQKIADNGRLRNR